MYYFIYFSGVVFFSMQNKTKSQCMPKMTNFLPERNAAIGKPTTIKTSKQAKKQLLYIVQYLTILLLLVLFNFGYNQ